MISETRDHGSHKADLEEVVEEVGRSNVVVYALPFSSSLSQVLDTERGLNQDEWRPVGAPFDIGAPLLMTLNATRKNVSKGLASMTGGVNTSYSLLARASKTICLISQIDCTAARYSASNRRIRMSVFIDSACTYVNRRI